jgi:hypothetical protein
VTSLRSSCTLTSFWEQKRDRGGRRGGGGAFQPECPTFWFTSVTTMWQHRPLTVATRAPGGLRATHSDCHKTRHFDRCTRVQPASATSGDFIRLAPLVQWHHNINDQVRLSPDPKPPLTTKSRSSLGLEEPKIPGRVQLSMGSAEATEKGQFYKHRIALCLIDRILAIL